MKNDMVYLFCTSKDVCNSRMFFAGKEYKAYDNGLTYHVIDEIGHVRVIGKEDMRFCVENKDRNPAYVYFEVIGK